MPPSLMGRFGAQIASEPAYRFEHEPPHAEVIEVKRLLYPGRLKTRWDFPLYPDRLPPTVTAALPPFSTAGYTITTEVAYLLAQLVTYRHPSRVLEIGAGSSSVVFAAALAAAGKGTLTSVEQSPEWCRDAWRKVEATRIDAEMIVSQPIFDLTPFPCHQHPTRELVKARGPYDLVLVDAPQWYYGRDGALPLCAESLAQGALIVVDDAGRHQEQWAIRRWLWTYPGLRLLVFDPVFGRNGVAVLGWSCQGERPSARAWLTGLLHGAVGWMVRWNRQLNPKGVVP